MCRIIFFFANTSMTLSASNIIIKTPDRTVFIRLFEPVTRLIDRFTIKVGSVNTILISDIFYGSDHSVPITDNL